MKVLSLNNNSAEPHFAYNPLSLLALSMADRECAAGTSPSFELDAIQRSSKSYDSSRRDEEDDDEYELQWAAIERLPTLRRMKMSVLHSPGNGTGSQEHKEAQIVDVTKLGAVDRRMLVEKLIKSIENDNLRLNGFKLAEFVPEKTSAYVSQYDLHIAEMTVRETLDFSARFQGVGSRAGNFFTSI